VKRIKKYLLRTAIGLFLIVAVLLITNATLLSIRGARLAKKIAAIRAAGDPVSFSQLAPAAVPPEKNAAVFLARAQAGIGNISKELNAVYSQDGYITGQLSASDFKTIESALQGSPEVVSLVRKAAECPEYDSQNDYSVNPEDFISNHLTRLMHFRAVMRLLTAHAYLQLEHGDRDEAIQDCLAMLRLSRLYELEPMVIAFLVAQAGRMHARESANVVLRSGPLKMSTYAALEAELALHEKTDGYVHALKTERVFGIESFQSYRLTMGWLQAGFLSDECDYLDLISEQLEYALLPYSDLASAGVNSKYEGRVGPLTQSTLHAVVGCRTAFERTRAQLRCLRILNAVVSRDHATGKAQPIPSVELEDLSLPAEATTDPFTGNPLQYRNQNGQWLIYSTGEDLKDDGGDLRESRDIGVGPVPPRS
jgi:hypothetical protein